jgi:pimeloyl-ACP methyl ester carboxylesterase
MLAIPALCWLPHFRLHLVDLPGFGRSQGFGPLSLAQMAQQLLPPQDRDRLCLWCASKANSSVTLPKSEKEVAMLAIPIITHASERVPRRRPAQAASARLIAAGRQSAAGTLIGYTPEK